MKKLLPILFLIIALSAFSQVPSYYNNTNLNLNGTALKNELASKIISTHTTNISYTPGVWNALKQADLDPTNASRVLLVYGYSSSGVTARTRGVDDNGGSTGNWNREHVYPRSLGNPNLGSTGPGSDAHHIRPADVTFNSQRGSLKFVDGSGNAGSTSGGWYPGDEWKGDVARMMMYMYLRYGNQCLPKNVGIGNTIASDANMIQLFLEWNVEDPVSDFEKQRNPILEGIQGNRNPFIDNPAFATQIWGGPQAEDLFGNGGNGNGGTTDLLISEYIEGSSLNKAIEIVNLTGNTVNLSSYSLRKSINGNNSFSSTYNLSGQLANGEVFVIAHSSASSTITNVANTVTSSSIMSFNGNDAVGLFKNGVLIDVVGNPSNSANFAQNTTLRRKTSITNSNTTYTATEWDTFPNNTFDDLGVYTGNTTPNPPTIITYCETKGNNTNFEYIDTVVIGGISNSTAANGGYGDFTNLTGNLPYGSNTIILSAGFTGSAYTEFWSVWIDFNKNGTFESTEQVVSGSSSSSGNLSYTFTIPSSALAGKTRMRVAMKWNAAATPCETFSYGEVEDYTVSIGTSSKQLNTTQNVSIDGELGSEAAIFDAIVYPNPAVNTITVALKDSRKATYKIINTLGQTVKVGTIDKDINIANLNNGLYILEVNDGQKSFIKKFIKK